ncbi:MAG: hypothetical protein Q8P15_00630 [Nanoarchaeota archaeon]|nr:hypothetical protein [Nanoarchaeota archaeon]
MAKTGMWLAVVGGVLAVIGQWVLGYYLPLIGGVLAVIGGFMK